ncbi:MAG: hypothetical protein IKR04_06610 [Clostridia bacterium]|nr:hypothetical protein [Clostridia bacterium]
MEQVSVMEMEQVMKAPEGYEWIRHDGFSRLTPKNRPKILLEYIDDQDNTLYHLDFCESNNPGWIVKINEELAHAYHGTRNLTGENLQKPVESNGQMICMIPRDYELVKITRKNSDAQEDFIRLQPKGEWWTVAAPKRAPVYVPKAFRPIIWFDMGKVIIEAFPVEDIEVLGKPVEIPRK